MTSRSVTVASAPEVMRGAAGSGVITGVAADARGPVRTVAAPSPTAALPARKERRVRVRLGRVFSFIPGTVRA